MNCKIRKWNEKFYNCTETESDTIYNTLFSKKINKTLAQYKYVESYMPVWTSINSPH